MSTKHFNIFNTGESSFFTPGVQLANIARVKPDAPAIVYINPENKESVMTWHSLDVLSNRIAWYLLEQGTISLQEIAKECGFSDYIYFLKIQKFSAKITQMLLFIYY